MTFVIWGLLFLGMATVSLWGIWMMAGRLMRFAVIKKIAKENRRFRLLLFGLIIAIMIGTGVFWNAWNATLIFVHFVFIWMLADGVEYLIVSRVLKFSKERRTTKNYPYYAGVMAMVFSLAILALGFYLDFSVGEKAYYFATDKSISNIKIAMISDSHVGVTFDGEGFAKELAKIQQTNPDVLVVVGDFIDDDTTYEDMVRSCKALGDFRAKNGIYFVFGNHDKGYYSSARGYDGDVLYEELVKNGVTVLQDEVVLLEDSYYIIGRKDANEERLSMKELTDGLDPSKYMVVLDHQPNDYKAEEAAEVDLVLSGHTHGGQLFPLNVLTAMTGIHDQIYGHEKRGNTDFVVSSGISNWAIYFKTCCRSEYVIAEISKTK